MWHAWDNRNVQWENLERIERLEKEASQTDLGKDCVHRRAFVSTAMNCEAFTKQVLS